MGLFETLTNTRSGGAAVGKDGSSSSSPTSASTSKKSSPATLPTVIQMYSGSQQPILLDASTAASKETSCTPSTTLTYQALQVGALPAEGGGGGSAENKKLLSSIHVAPDVGVWNCRVSPSTGGVNNGTSGTSENALVDALLAQTARDASTFCWTVDLTDASTVEPNVGLLQSTLVRHLIQHPPGSGSVADDPSVTTGDGGVDDKTKTTTLYDLQAVQFGLATDDPASNTPKTIEEATKDVKITLMICAVLPSDDKTTDSGDAYRAKQAEALVVYHLRKFANAVNAALCFVPPYSTLNIADTTKGGAENKDSVLSPSKQQSESGSAPSEASIGVDGSSESEQPTISYDKLVKLWRDLAMGVLVWQEGDDTPSATSSLEPSTDSSGESTDAAAVTAASALYGPGKQQEDLIETLLLRNANYPGHWEASKDSLWVALPSSMGMSSNDDNGSRAVGDAGWLAELRESIASALPAETTASDDAAAGGAASSGGESKKDDAGDTKEVTDFFQSLISSKK